MRLHGTSLAKCFPNLCVNISFVYGTSTKTGDIRFVVTISEFTTEIKMRFQLREKVANVAERKTIYHQLCVLRWERDPVLFEKMLPTFVDRLPQDFQKYFITYYLTRKEKWAVCYRHPELPDTTAHPESFHRVLKHVYMQGQNVLSQQ